VTDIYISPGLRTPFVKAGNDFAAYDALDLSIPVAKAMAAMATPDFLVWGQVIPRVTVSNIGRELVFEAGLEPDTPAFSTVMACSTSLLGVIEAAGMLGHGDTHLALVGGVETMSHIPLSLSTASADRIVATFAKDPQRAGAMLAATGAVDFELPRQAWANKQSGRSQGQHTEDTARHFKVSRNAQDERALLSHRAAVAAQDAGFFDDLIVPVGDIRRDMIPRRDTSLERLASLPPAFASDGSLTAGNSSPLTDGAAAVWVGDREGMRALGRAPVVLLVDWQIAAMDFRSNDEGILMAPARAIARLLARQDLSFREIALWNIHEAFAAQVIANIEAVSNPTYRREKAGVDVDLGVFDWSSVNPHGGSLALGHPFAATGARILSQAAKELAAMPSGTFGIVSVCADGGQGTVTLLQRV
jgi:acetyl-CoA C-acetyltransferase